MRAEWAPAKVNLSLRVVRRRADGRHDLESLVAFAGAGDLLSFEPGPDLSLAVDGPTAGAAGPAADNLVLRAAAALAARVPGLRLGRFRLTKRLPVAAGIGGGSSDAAAALRLLALENGLSLDDARLFQAARETGGDIPVCLAPRARMMAATGDELGPPLALPPLFAVLVNPGVPLATADVFARLGLAKGAENPVAAAPLRLPAAMSQASPANPAPLRGRAGSGGGEAHIAFDDLVAALRPSGNDLEDAAGVLQPVIGHVLAVLAAARGARLARMSGSGATCFALFQTCRAAARAAAVIRRDHPGWWAKATVLR